MSDEENLLGHYISIVTSALQAGFDAMDKDNYNVEPVSSFAKAVWGFHMRIRELVLDEACRIIRRKANQMIDGTSDEWQKEDVETFASAFIAAIQKDRGFKRKPEGS